MAVGNFILLVRNHKVSFLTAKRYKFILKKGKEYKGREKKNTKIFDSTLKLFIIQI